MVTGQGRTCRALLTQTVNMLLLFFGVARGAVMNAGGVPYAISNPAADGEYSLDFEENVKGRVEHFDVYGEVQTGYSQVYWTRNAPISLPPALVERFNGKVMAITGYEVDQVVSPHAPPAPPAGTPLSGTGIIQTCEVERCRARRTDSRRAPR